MSRFCTTHRAPRAGIDPIVDPASALAVIRLAISWPAEAETVVLVLDPDRRGRTVVVVQGTRYDDDVVEVVERFAEAIAWEIEDMAAGASPAGMIVASVRPGRGPEPADADRWLEAGAVAETFGVELIEWFVLEAHGGDDHDRFTAWCPRDLLAEPPRWHPS